MKNHLTIAIALLVPACIIAVEDDGSRPRPGPPPPGAPPPAVERSMMIKYRAKVEPVFEALKASLVRNGFRLNDTYTRGDDNWWLTAFRTNGATQVKVYLNRRDHKTRTHIEVESTALTPYEVKELLRRLHQHLGERLGERGDD